MILLIVVLLFIIALPSILNILGITWLIGNIFIYKYYIITIILFAIILLVFTNKDKLK